MQIFTRYHFLLRYFFRDMLIEVKAADGDVDLKTVIALEDLESGSEVWIGAVTESQPGPDFNRTFGPWTSGGTGRLLLFTGEANTPGEAPGDDSCVEFLKPDDETTILALAGIPSLPHVDFKLFSELHRGMKEYESRRTVNAELCLTKKAKNGGDVVVKTTEKILKGSEVRVKLNRNTLLRQLLRNVPPADVLPRLAILTLLQPFNNPDILPENLKGYEHFFVKWRLWSQTMCAAFIQTVLGSPVGGPVMVALHCQGFAPRTQLYRMLQAVGAIKPPTLAMYEKYPEALRCTAHQSRDLCFWPVPVGPEHEATERMRKKIQEGLQFGPNATWTDYPKTKLLFMAASSDNLGLAEEVLENKRVNVNSFGSCENWTPLHVACHHGSLRVAKILLTRGAIFNPRDKQGRTPLALAEAGGHTNLAKLLLTHAATHSILPHTSVSIVREPCDNDPKLASLEAAVNCKNVGNSAYKNANYKTAFKLYSRGLEHCPENHPEKVILLSNRAQVLITAQAFHLALRDINEALAIDPLHEKTLLRRAHCQERDAPERALTDLDLLLQMSVPDKLVQERRSHLFLKSLVKEGLQEEVKEEKHGNDNEAVTLTDVVTVQGKEYKSEELPMDILMDLTLEELRELDIKFSELKTKNEESE